MWHLLRRAPARFGKSFGYCRDAFVAMFRKEESFRLELIALVVLIAVLLLSGWPWWKRSLLIGGYLLVPLTEMLNSAIEDVCDLISGEWNERIKSAKDKGALAVLAAIIVNVFLLAALLLIED